MPLLLRLQQRRCYYRPLISFIAVINKSNNDFHRRCVVTRVTLCSISSNDDGNDESRRGDRDGRTSGSSSSSRSLTHGNLIDTASILSPDYRFLSPCLGAALSTNSPYIGNMLRLGKITARMLKEEGEVHRDETKKPKNKRKDSRPSQQMKNSETSSCQIDHPARLATLLYYQQSRQHPPRLTRNKSMAAAHLTPRLIGIILGLALSKDDNDIQRVLLKEGIRSNHLHDEWTGVSLARWKALITATTTTEKGSIYLTSALWLQALWEISTTKLDLLHYILALQESSKLPILDETSELAMSLVHDPTAQTEWATSSFHAEQDLSTESVRLAMNHLLPSSSIKQHQQESCFSKDLEIACASMAIQHQDKPTISQGYYGYDGGEPKPGTWRCAKSSFIYHLVDQ